MKTLLIPIDLTEKSKILIQYALDLKKIFECKIVFLHVYTVRIPVATTGAVALGVQPSIHEAEREEKYKKTLFFLKDLGITEDLNSEIVIRSGPVSNAIVETSNSKKVDLIILGTSEISPIEEFFTGAISEKIGRLASCSVLILPDHFKSSPIKNISLLIDQIGFKSRSRLEFLKQILQGFKSVLQIVHVTEEKESMLDRDQVIDHYIKPLGNPVYSLFIVENENPKDVIHRFLDDKPINLSVILYREHSYLKRLFSPGLRKELSINTNIPLLILK